MRNTRPIVLPICAALSILIIGLIPISNLAGFDLRFTATALIAFLSVGGLVAWGWTRQANHTRRFGPANSVTFLRAVLVCWIAGAIGQAGSDWASWFIVVIGTTALILDGVDGWVARQYRCESDFGARFDQEIDALLILILAILAMQTGKAGTWILLAGLLRYLFIAAAIAVPKLAAPLPPSKRRQTICVVTVIALILCLAPIVTPPVSRLIAALAVSALVLSFAVDTAWLLHQVTPAEGKEDTC